MCESEDERRVTINGFGLTVAELVKKDLVAIYNAIWQNMQRENDLINNRIMWAIVISAAFITAQAFIAGSIISGMGDSSSCTLSSTPSGNVCMLVDSGAHQDNLARRKESNDVFIMQCMACTLMTVLSIAAAYASLRCQAAVKAAIHQLSYLKYYYYRTLIDDKNLFESYLYLPRPFGDSLAHKSGNSAATILCPILLVIWSILAVSQFVAAIIFLASAVGQS